MVVLKMLRIVMILRIWTVVWRIKIRSNVLLKMMNALKKNVKVLNILNMIQIKNVQID